MKPYQEQLFYDWDDTCSHIEALSGYIQNDFDRMLEIGDTNREQIKVNLFEFKAKFDFYMQRLQDHKERIIKLMQEKSV